MKSLTYLIPRLIIIGLLLLAVVLGADPIIQRATVYHIQQATGAKVEIGQVKANLAEDRLFLKSMAIADPNALMENLFQADIASIKINRDALWNRQLIIESARASQVRFGAPRTVSGSLHSIAPIFPPATDPLQSRDTNSTPNFFEDQSERLSLAWMDQFHTQHFLSRRSLPDVPIALIDEANQATLRWQQRLKKHRSDLDELNDVLASIQNQTQNEDAPQEANPLRPLVAKQPPKWVDEVAAKIAALNQQRQSIQRDAEADLKKLRSIYQADLSVEDSTSEPMIAKLSPKVVSELLLRRVHEELATESIDWFRWLQSKVDSQLQLPKRSRGEAIFLHESLSQPSWIIKTIEIDGEGHLGTEHFDFSGQINQLTDCPQVHDQPVSFQLRALGERHFSLDCTIDRRIGEQKDQLRIQFPSFELGEKLLGSDKDIQITMSPKTKLHGLIDLRRNGSEMSGTMDLSFTNVALEVDHLGKIAGGTEVRSRLNQRLLNLHEFQAKVTIGGTLERPTMQLQSDLGFEVASAIIEANKFEFQKISQSKTARIEKIESVYEDSVQRLGRDIEQQLSDTRRRLQDFSGHIKRFQQPRRTAKSRWPEIR